MNEMPKSRTIPALLAEQGNLEDADGALRFLAEGCDAAGDVEQVVGCGRDHGINQIVPRPLVAEIDFQAIVEEGEKVRSKPTRPFRHRPS